VLAGKIDPYVDYQIKKNRFGKLRSISSPFPELKELQSKLLEEMYRIEGHETSHAYAKGKSVVTAAQPHLRMKWGIRLDIEDFFHHVTHHQVTKVLAGTFGSNRAKIYSNLATRSPLATRSRLPRKFNRRFNFWKVRDWKFWLKQNLGHTVMQSDSKLTFRVLRQRLGTRRYLPQGSPTSGHLANLVFRSVDAEISKLVGRVGFTYSRYSDDILLSTKSVTFDRKLAVKLIHQIQVILNRQGFTLNRSKTRILSPGSRMAYLGMLLDGRVTRLPRQVRARIAGALRDIVKFGFDDQAIRFENGLTRISPKDSSIRTANSNYWSYLHGYICWVELVDPVFFLKLSQIYKKDLSNLADANSIEITEEYAILASLFTRKSQSPKVGSRSNLADDTPF
jgi:RNA-directed DNA polymerase